MQRSDPCSDCDLSRAGSILPAYAGDVRQNRHNDTHRCMEEYTTMNFEKNSTSNDDETKKTERTKLKLLTKTDRTYIYNILKLLETQQEMLSNEVRRAVVADRLFSDCLEHNDLVVRPRNDQGARRKTNHIIR